MVRRGDIVLGQFPFTDLSLNSPRFPGVPHPFTNPISLRHPVRMSFRRICHVPTIP